MGQLVTFSWPRCPFPGPLSPWPTSPLPAVLPCVRRSVKSTRLFRNTRCPASQGFQRSRCAEVQLPHGLNPGAWAPGPQRPNAGPLNLTESPGTAPNLCWKDPTWTHSAGTISMGGLGKAGQALQPPAQPVTVRANTSSVRTCAGATFRVFLYINSVLEQDSEFHKKWKRRHRARFYDSQGE